MSIEHLGEVHGETDAEKVRILERGLGRTGSPKRITVLGAGMAGLTSAYLLRQAGHDVTVLEANSRVGGRVHTMKEPFEGDGYMEAGAMRIPVNHQLTRTLVDKFGLETEPFISRAADDLYFINGQLARSYQYEENPDIFDIPVDEREKGLHATALLMQTAGSFGRAYVDASPQDRLRLIAAYDQYSKEIFARLNPGGYPLSTNATHKMNSVLGIGGFAHYSFVDILLNIVGPLIGDNGEFFQIRGGNVRLPEAFLSDLGDRIFLGESVVRIAQENDRTSVTVENIEGEQREVESDYTVCTLPFSILRMIETGPEYEWSFGKRQAIQDMHYIAAIKVGLEFKRKFWEDDALFGGSLTTDLPPQHFIYPSSRVGIPGPGVMKGAYAWGANASLWDAMPEDVRVRQALRYVAKVHGDHVEDLFMNGASFSWGTNPFSAGCFSMFRPGQASTLPGAIRRPEGRVHFAGEHTSDTHAWVEGAVESGVRAAVEVHGRGD
ncbi:flavin monoamine oxidase family protein [Alteribacter natronophilus]|uniref:flavin monoamine oxidase family protein n=1 Tax=Alteribacter natronophilus TaxID=2583810 RepID=UPI001485EA6C|nr:flavin monoamine oxidase family protein [Alteribacter natronophilus]